MKKKFVVLILICLMAELCHAQKPFKRSKSQVQQICEQYTLPELLGAIEMNKVDANNLYIEQSALKENSDKKISYSMTDPKEIIKQVKKSRNLLEYSKDSIWKAFEMEVFTIYGSDDRFDPYVKVSDPYKNDCKKVACLMAKKNLIENPDGSFNINCDNTLKDDYSLCDTVRFASQPSVGFCSGFAIDRFIICTEGHCIAPYDLADLVFVFGFQMVDDYTAIRKIPASDVYMLTKILSFSENDTADWALIKVNREIPDYRIAKYRQTGKIPNNQELFVIGHPSGLPMKVALNARVNINSNHSYFYTNLDTYGGNSGSPVFNSKTHEVEGILKSGCVDYIYLEKKSNCKIPYRWSADSNCKGEKVIRITQILPILKGIQIN